MTALTREHPFRYIGHIVSCRAEPPVPLWFDVDVSTGSVADLTYVVTIEDRCADVEVTRMHEPLELDDLVARARAGDQASWNALVDRFLPLVNSVIAKFRLSAADGDDVNQTVWLRLVEHLGDLREPRALPGWLVTTARNEALRVIRLRGRATPVDPQGYDPRSRRRAARGRRGPDPRRAGSGVSRGPARAPGRAARAARAAARRIRRSPTTRSAPSWESPKAASARPGPGLWNNCGTPGRCAPW